MIHFSPILSVDSIRNFRLFVDFLMLNSDEKKTNQESVNIGMNFGETKTKLQIESFLAKKIV
jgi:hypothetical protein